MEDCRAVGVGWGQYFLWKVGLAILRASVVVVVFHVAI